METLAFPLEFKQISDAGHVEGLAAAFGNVDRGGDRLLAGAFAKSLANRGGRPLPMLLYHDLCRPIGSWTEVREENGGLSVKGKLTLSTRDGAEAYALARDGALTGLSIGYKALRHAPSPTAVRDLHEVDLFEVSLVPIPMNEKTQLRAVKAIASLDDLREHLKIGGFSSREAKAMAGAAWRARQHPENSIDLGELTQILDQSAARVAGL